MHSRLLLSIAASSLLASSLSAQTLSAQTIPQTAPAKPPATRPSEIGAGDSLDHIPPLANLSPALRRTAVAAAMRKVGDWELARSQPYFSRDWTFAALYAGYIAAAHALPEPRYESAMLEMGNHFNWTPGPRKTVADDQAVAQTYLGLYHDYREPRMILPTQVQFDALMKQPDDPAHPVWWWCDALFMAPPVWARLYGATHDLAYLQYMDRKWSITSTLLYYP
jgi:rhamnogalacturonyl hydrolase YesR